MQFDATKNERSNPFPATAVARLTKNSQELLTIETAALKQLRAQVNDYLHNRADVGKTLCIIGEYGTGKTHLLMEILRVIQETQDNTLHAFYLDAPSDNFLSLYQERFLPRLDPLEVHRRLREAFAEVVAKELEGDLIYSDLTSQIRSGTLDPIAVVKQVGLMESKLLRQFKESLKGITEDECFATALYLFSIPEFQDAIWAWFRGNEPEDALRERGITKVINNDAIALETIGVLAFLFGQQGHRFVLLIDELEKVFSSENVPTESTFLAFKKLFEAISKTKALLVLSGLPDFYEALPEDAKQRVSMVIKPSLLKQADVAEYIREANKKSFGKGQLDPFSSSMIDYIVTLASGNARKIIRICYHTFQVAISENTKVSRSIIREVIQDQFAAESKEQVEQEIMQVIEKRGWLFETEQFLDETGQVGKKTGTNIVRLDYWLPIGKDDLGIGINHVTDIFSEDDKDAVIEKYGKISQKDRNGTKIASVLVISGFVAENLLKDLEDAFTRVIVYKSRDFSDALDAVLVGLRVRIEEREKEDKLDLVIFRLQQLDRQMGALQRFVSDRTASKNDVRTLIQLIRMGNQSGFKFSPTVSPSTPGASYFEDVFSIFDNFDRLILLPFSSFSTPRLKETILYEFAENDGFVQFYLLHGLIVMNYYAQPLKGDNKLLSLRMSSMAPENNSFENIIVRVFESWKFDSFIHYISNTNLNTDSIRKDIDELAVIIKKLPTVDSRLRYKDAGPERWTLTSSALVAENNYFVTGFTELNDLFFTVQAGMNTIYKLIMQNPKILINQILKENRLEDDLANFFYLRRMVFLFIEIVNDGLDDVPIDQRIQRLGQLCPIFDDLFSIGSKKFRKSSRQGILRYLERALLNQPNSYEVKDGLDELLSNVFALPRQTYDLLGDIRSKPSGGER
jgi:Cdc6-like AAA superfamily ATPase